MIKHVHAPIDTQERKTSLSFDLTLLNLNLPRFLTKFNKENEEGVF